MLQLLLRPLKYMVGTQISIVPTKVPHINIHHIPFMKAQKPPIIPV